MRERPISVLIFGILNILFGLLAYFGILMSMAMAHMKTNNAALNLMHSDPTFARFTQIQMMYAGVTGVFLIAAGIGLLMLQEWARILSMIYAAVDIIDVVISAYFSRFMFQAVAGQAHMPVSPQLMGVIMIIGMVIGSAFKLAYPVLLLVFMTRPKVRQAFEPMLPPPPV